MKGELISIIFIIIVCFCPSSGNLMPDLHWKFNSNPIDGFVNEVNSTIANRAFLLPGTKILNLHCWTVAEFNGNNSGVFIDNSTEQCTLNPGLCKSGLSISFSVKWPRNGTEVNNGSLVSSGNFSIFHDCNGKLVVSLWNGTNEWQLVHARNVSLYGWVCYLVTWDHHSLKMYINGSLKRELFKNNASNTVPLPSTGILKVRSEFSLGSDALPKRIVIGNTAKNKSNEHGLKMLFDDLKIWSFSLKSNQTDKYCSKATCGGKRAKQDPYKYRNQAYSSIEFANKALRGHMLKRKTAQSLIDCIHKCMERKRECLSFNIGHTNITNRYICELNKVSRKYYPHNVVDEHGYYYYDVYWV